MPAKTPTRPVQDLPAPAPRSWRDLSFTTDASFWHQVLTNKRMSEQSLRYVAMNRLTEVQDLMTTNPDDGAMVLQRAIIDGCQGGADGVMRYFIQYLVHYAQIGMKCDGLQFDAPAGWWDSAQQAH